MIYSWPPTGRMCELFPERRRSISSRNHRSLERSATPSFRVIQSTRPATTRLSADSTNAEAAYLFMQWAVSPPVSLARTMLPYSRDPYRLSHYKSELYRSLWPDAPAYLVNYRATRERGTARYGHAGWQDYALSVDRMCSSVWAEPIPRQPCKRPPPNGIERRSVWAKRAKRRFHGIQETARILCRPYGRGNGHGVKL